MSSQMEEDGALEVDEDRPKCDDAKMQSQMEEDGALAAPLSPSRESELDGYSVASGCDLQVSLKLSRSVQVSVSLRLPGLVHRRAF